MTMTAEDQAKYDAFAAWFYSEVAGRLLANDAHVQLVRTKALEILGAEWTVTFPNGGRTVLVHPPIRQILVTAAVE